MSLPAHGLTITPTVDTDSAIQQRSGDRLADGFGDARGIGHPVLLERRGERHRRERATDTPDRGVEVVERKLLDLRCDLTTQPSEADCLVNDDRVGWFGAPSRSIVSMSNGCSVRGSMTSHSIPSPARTSAASIVSLAILPQATTVTSLPSRSTWAVPSGMTYDSSGTGPLTPSNRLCLTMTVGLSSRMHAVIRPFMS